MLKLLGWGCIAWAWVHVYSDHREMGLHCLVLVVCVTYGLVEEATSSARREWVLKGLKKVLHYGGLGQGVMRGLGEGAAFMAWVHGCCKTFQNGQHCLGLFDDGCWEGGEKGLHWLSLSPFML